MKTFVKRLASYLLLLALVGGGFLVWYGYHTGQLHHPFEASKAPQTAAGASGGEASGRQNRGRGGGRGRRGGDDGPIPVLVVPARYEDVPVNLEAVGTIQALNTVTARTQVDGRLIALGFKDGQDVKQGDVLARIDPTTYQAQLDQAIAKKAQDEALLANARIDLVRYVKLASSDFGPKQQADTQKSLVAQYEAQVKGDQASIDNLRAILAYAIIKSPITGRTGIRLVDVGNILHASDAIGIVTIAQMQPIAMIFNLPQQNLLAVNTALAKGPVEVDALQADNITVLDEGVIDVVDNLVDQATGTIRIKAQFPNGDRHLWPGAFVNVRVHVSKLPHVVVIPSQAVQRGPNGPYCYVLADNDSVKLTLVEVGQQDENMAVIRKGLEPPAKVVTTGFARLTDGAKVAVSVADAGTPTSTPASTPAASASGEATAVVAPAAANGAAAPVSGSALRSAPRGADARHRRRDRAPAGGTPAGR